MANSVLDGSTDIQDGVIITPDEGTVIQFGGETLQFKAIGNQTGGRCAFMSATMAPESSGPPLHLHNAEDEIFYIVEGALLFQLGDRLVKAEARSFAYFPRGSVHAFCNPYKQPAKVVGFMTPAGFEG